MSVVDHRDLEQSTGTSALAEPTALAREEVEAPSLLAYPATYLLMGLNVAVYALMFRFGPVPDLFRAHPLSAVMLTTASGWRQISVLLAQAFTAPFGESVLTHFGSCLPLRILAGSEWWRLLTSLFVHVTLLHLVLNMWCLWNLGLFGEPLLGKPGLVATYLLTGAAGMLQTVLWSRATHDTGIIVAGASGAVFGLAGILIVLLSNRKLAAPWKELRSLRAQVVFFAVANLVLGMLPDLIVRFSPHTLRGLPFDPADLPRIDNNAHLGGFVCGLVLGSLLFPRMTSGRSSYRVRQAWVFGSAALFLMLVSYALASFTRAPTL
jgi:rhomboid protease GluP